MKTNLKTAILGIALMASVTGAFASNIVNLATGKTFASYTWDTYDENGNQTGNDIPGDENFSDCPDTPTDKPCAVGTPTIENPALPVLHRYYL